MRLLISIIVSEDSVSPDLRGPALLLLSCLSQHRKIAEFLSQPDFFSALLPLTPVSETVALLCSLAHFPSPCATVIDFFSVGRLLGVARLLGEDPELLHALALIVWYAARLPDLLSFVVSEIVEFAHFCLGRRAADVSSDLAVMALAALVKRYNISAQAESLGLIPICNELLFRLETQSVIAVVSFFASLLGWTHFHVEILNYEMLVRLVRANNAKVQSAVLEFWHTWLALFSSGQTPPIWAYVMDKLELATKLEGVVENGFFKARAVAVNCISFLLGLYPIDALVDCSPDFVQGVCEVLVGSRCSGVMISAMDILIAIMGDQEFQADSLPIIAEFLPVETFDEILEFKDPVVHQKAMALCSKLSSWADQGM